jgi:CheY-like chemotaxis protein
MSHLREQHGLRGIALSGFGTQADLAASRAAGFVNHLVKPVEWEHLDTAIRSATAPGHEPA